MAAQALGELTKPGSEGGEGGGSKKGKKGKKVRAAPEEDARRRRRRLWDKRMNVKKNVIPNSYLDCWNI